MNVSGRIGGDVEGRHSVRMLKAGVRRVVDAVADRHAIRGDGKTESSPYGPLRFEQTWVNVNGNRSGRRMVTAN